MITHLFRLQLAGILLLTAIMFFPSMGRAALVECAASGPTFAQAKMNFEKKCSVSYNTKAGHDCDPTKSGGWNCSGKIEQKVSVATSSDKGEICAVSRPSYKASIDFFESHCGFSSAKAVDFRCKLDSGKWLCLGYPPATFVENNDGASNQNGGVVQTSICSAAASSLSVARNNFEKKCKVAYDKSKGHDCDRKGSTWTCVGEVAVSVNVQPSTPVTTDGADTKICFIRRTTQELAKADFKKQCGIDFAQAYNAECQRITGGEHEGKWLCNGGVPVGVTEVTETTNNGGSNDDAGALCSVSTLSKAKITVNAGQSIQSAINKAAPGTIIEVKAGTYNETVLISAKSNSRLNNTSASAPIIIKSVDGRGKAIIRQPNGDKNPPFFVNSVSHVIIEGFRIIENQGGSDISPIKIINGNDTSKVADVHGYVQILNNDIEGSNQDLIKVGRAHNLKIIGNTFKGNVSDAGIDLVTVWNSEIAYNDMAVKANNGITMKAGSQNITIHHNKFDGGNLKPVIKIGGEGHSRTNRTTPSANFLGFEAKNITVRNNVVLSDGDDVLWFQGGQNSIIEDNYFKKASSTGRLYSAKRAPSGPWANESGSAPLNHPSINNVIRNNIMDGDFNNGHVDGAPHPQMSGNKSGTLSNVNFKYGVSSCR